jgi:hypothetical protein
MVTASPAWRVVAMTVVIGNTGCASMNGAPTRNDVDDAIRARTAAGIRIDSEQPHSIGLR